MPDGLHAYGPIALSRPRHECGIIHAERQPGNRRRIAGLVCKRLTCPMERREQRRPIWDAAGSAAVLHEPRRRIPRHLTIPNLKLVLGAGFIFGVIVLIVLEAVAFHEARAKILLIASGLVLLFVLIYVPRWQTRRLAASAPNERFDRENEARKTIAQVIGGLAVLTTLYFTSETLSLSQQQLRVASEGQVTDRFTRAIEQLGANETSGTPKLEVRLGAIYALARIANDSPKDRGPITEILSAYVRQHAPIPPNLQDEEGPDAVPGPSAEIPSIITVLGRLPDSSIESTVPKLDLSSSNLSGITMTGDFNGADLSSARLGRADMRNAHLLKAILFESHLNSAHLDNADLPNADLSGAHMHYATSFRTKFINAKLQRAQLYRADVREADFSGAVLTDTDFTSVDLTRARGLCREQLADIVKGRGTIVPKSLPPCNTPKRR